MPDYTYVIVGGGMTADAAAHAVREVDPTGSIGLIGAEPHPPYNRPPLSKALWKGDAEQTIWLHRCDRRPAAPRPTRHRDRLPGPHGDGRPRHGVPVREAPARDR